MPLIAPQLHGYGCAVLVPGLDARRHATGDPRIVFQRLVDDARCSQELHIQQSQTDVCEPLLATTLEEEGRAARDDSADDDADQAEGRSDPHASEPTSCSLTL